jgi:phosphoribosylglycinamide formyltransferase 1
MRKRAAVLISGRGSNLSALMDATKDAAYPAEIALVISNRAEAAGLARAIDAGIPTSIVDHRPFGKNREAFERALNAVLEAYRIDIVCLAGFMRVLSPWLLTRWPDLILNIHPSLLPAFPGLDTHERALEAGVKIHGATVHFAVPDVDAGPIIAQAAVPVLDDDTADTLAARVLTVEHRIYPLALKLVAEGRVKIEDGCCRIDGVAASGDPLIAPKIIAD